MKTLLAVFVGALLGVAILALAGGVWTLGVPLALVSLLLMVVLIRISRSGGESSRPTGQYAETERHFW